MQQPLTSNTPPKTQRLLSLDALRGFDMFWIVCGEGIFHGIATVIMQQHNLIRNAVNWQIAATDDLNVVERLFIGISNQLHHTPWNGFTFYDLIFPLFIFIAGVSVPFSTAKSLNKRTVSMAIAKQQIIRALFKRTVILILLGMIVNGALQMNGYNNTRIASVLGRIGLSVFLLLLFISTLIENGN